VSIQQGFLAMIRSTTKCDLDHIIDVGAGQGFRGRGYRWPA
jgi:hypothetical protein